MQIFSNKIQLINTEYFYSMINASLMDCYILSEEIQVKLKSPYLLYKEKIELFKTYMVIEALMKDKLLSLEGEEDTSEK